MSEYEFNRQIFNSSKILECTVKDRNNIISDKKKYKSILEDIWLSMTTQNMIKKSSFNMKLTDENNVDGYKWRPKFRLSIQFKNAEYTMYEILSMVKENNYSLDITIQLKTNKIIKFQYPKK